MLTARSKTWEKAFYFLLLQYRNKHLENFNPEPEQHRAISGQLACLLDSTKLTLA